MYTPNTSWKTADQFKLIGIFVEPCFTHTKPDGLIKLNSAGPCHNRLEWQGQRSSLHHNTRFKLTIFSTSMNLKINAVASQFLRLLYLPLKWLTGEFFQCHIFSVKSTQNIDNVLAYNSKLLHFMSTV